MAGEFFVKFFFRRITVEFFGYYTLLSFYKITKNQKGVTWLNEPSAHEGEAFGRGLGYLSYIHNTYQYRTDEISGVQYGIEMGSTTIGTFAPFPFNIAWTIGYEGLGRHGVTRIPWYQNNFKPWARNHMGLKTTTIRP